MNVNLLEVLVAAIIPMVIGFIWYGPLFGNQWMKISGITKKDMQKDMSKTYGIMFVGALVMSYVLAHFITYTGANDLISGAVGGFWIWLGFIASVRISDVLFNKGSMNLYYLDVAYRLVSLLAMGAVLGMWR